MQPCLQCNLHSLNRATSCHVSSWGITEFTEVTLQQTCAGEPNQHGWLPVCCGHGHGLGLHQCQPVCKQVVGFRGHTVPLGAPGGAQTAVGWLHAAAAGAIAQLGPSVEKRQLRVCAAQKLASQAPRQHAQGGIPTAILCCIAGILLLGGHLATILPRMDRGRAHSARAGTVSRLVGTSTDKHWQICLGHQRRSGVLGIL